VAGHILECGSQSSGNFTDWRLVPTFANRLPRRGIGRRTAVDKHPGTGGSPSTRCASRSLRWATRGPPHPDVVADFSTIRLAPAGENRVRVSGIRGAEPTGLYKVSMAYRDGFKAGGAIVVCGPDARAKAEAFAGIFWERAGSDYLETSTEYYGWNACHGDLGHAADGEEIMRPARALDRGELRRFGKALPSLISAGLPAPR
jgi:hypothetical protein